MITPMLIKPINTIYQATGIGGVGGVFLVYPPWPKIFRKYPPWRFWVKPPFCFLNERKTLKFTLIQLDLGLIKLN